MTWRSSCQSPCASTPDIETYETFVTARLGAVPGIARIDSHLTMKVVKSPERPRQQHRRRDG